MSNKKVLSDHKMVKKKLIPPMLQEKPGYDIKHIDVSYIDRVLPEIIWQAFLNDKLGVTKGSQISLELLKEIQSILGVDKCKLFCFISNFELLTKSQIDSLNSVLFLNEGFKEIKEAILPFIKVFPDCPLNVLYHEKIPKFNDDDLNYVKSIISSILDKTSVVSTHSLSNTFYYAFQLERIKVHKESSLLKLQEIQFYPDTEISLMVAGSLRASINMFFRDEFIIADGKWRNYFWNRAHQIEPNNINNLYFEL